MPAVRLRDALPFAALHRHVIFVVREPRGRGFRIVRTGMLPSWPLPPRRVVVHQLRIFTRLAAILILALASGHAWDQAKSSRYAVVLVMDEPVLRALIERHVQVFAEHTDPLLSEERFRYLSRVAVQEIEQLMATEGYFAPRVDYRIEEDAQTLTAHYAVTPGSPTTVASFTLQFRGAILEDTAGNRALREQLRKSWPLQQGTVLRSADWEKAKEQRGSPPSLTCLHRNDSA